MQTSINYPAIRVCGYGQKAAFYLNHEALQYIPSSKISVFKANIKGDQYLCLTAANSGHTLTDVRGGATVCATRILEFSGIPIEAFGVRRCVRIPGGVAFKIIQ